MSFIIKHIQNQITRNRNFVGIFVGRVGTGKSYSAMRFAEQLDPEFSEERVFFKVEDLLETINAGTLKAGNVIILDEGGIAVSNRQHYMDKFNKAMSYLLQTWRHRNIIMFVTVPDIAFVDAGIRKMFDAIIECKEVLKKKKVVRISWKFIQVNTQSGKAYFHNPRLGMSVINLEVKKPHFMLIRRYEKKKTDFTTNLYDSLKDRLEPDKPKVNEARERLKCPNCNSMQVRYVEKVQGQKCRICGHIWKIVGVKATNV